MQALEAAKKAKPKKLDSKQDTVSFTEQMYDNLFKVWS